VPVIEGNNSNSAATSGGAVMGVVQIEILRDLVSMIPGAEGVSQNSLVCDILETISVRFVRGESMQIDHAVLEAALVGYQFQLKTVQEKMAVLRSEMGHKTARVAVATVTGEEGAPTKRTMSAAARKRIAAAQKKRWAEFHAAKEGP
jgi:hypothetical protein